MNNPVKGDPFDVLGQAYEKMYEQAVEKFHKAEHKTAELFEELVDEAVDTAVEMDEVSREDALKLAKFIKRDVSHAIDYLKETGRELKDWLGFETTFLEMEFVDNLLQVADPTTVEWLRLKQQAQDYQYHTGEVTGPGTLVCDNCGEKLHFHRAGKIPPCPKCKATAFHRLPE